MCMGDHKICIPYKILGDHKHHIVHGGGPHIHVGDHMIPIPYKVWGDHKSHIRHEDTSHVGGP